MDGYFGKVVVPSDEVSGRRGFLGNRKHVTKDIGSCGNGQVTGCDPNGAVNALEWHGCHWTTPYALVSVPLVVKPPKVGK